MARLIRLVLSRLLGWQYDGFEEHRRRLATELPFIAFRPRRYFAARTTMNLLYREGERRDHTLMSTDKDDVLERMWAYRQSLWLLDQFDAEGIYSAKADEPIWKNSTWKRFFNTYRLTGRFNASLRDKPQLVFAALDRLFKAPLTDSDVVTALTMCWFEGVSKLGVIAKHTEAGVAPKLMSLVSKLLWFYQPHAMTMYDKRATCGLAIVTRKKTIDPHYFLSTFEELFLAKVDAIALAENASDRKYPYPRRVLDQWLWLKGGTDADDLVRCFRLSLDRAPMRVSAA